MINGMIKEPRGVVSKWKFKDRAQRDGKRGYAQSVKPMFSDNGNESKIISESKPGQ